MSLNKFPDDYRHLVEDFKKDPEDFLPGCKVAEIDQFPHGELIKLRTQDPSLMISGLVGITRTEAGLALYSQKDCKMRAKFEVNMNQAALRLLQVEIKELSLQDPNFVHGLVTIYDPNSEMEAVGYTDFVEHGADFRFTGEIPLPTEETRTFESICEAEHGGYVRGVKALTRDDPKFAINLHSQTGFPHTDFVTLTFFPVQDDRKRVLNVMGSCFTSKKQLRNSPETIAKLAKINHKINPSGKINTNRDYHRGMMVSLDEFVGIKRRMQTPFEFEPVPQHLTVVTLREMFRRHVESLLPPTAPAKA